MLKFLLKLKKFLTLVLLLILAVILLCVIDKYLIHPNSKGISLLDIKNISRYIVAPIAIAILLLKLIQKKEIKS